MTKGISLHIALNKVDKKVYNTEGVLNSCLNSARALAGMCISEGFEKYTILHNEQSTKQYFINNIKLIANTLNSGDVFLLSFSGHGGQLADTNLDEQEYNPLDKNDETWCFFDGVLKDDEIYDLWRYFNSNIRIIVIADSCHSGTIIKGILGENIFKREVIPSNSLPSIVLLSACQDSQESADGKYQSLYISELLRIWNWGRFSGNYLDFNNQIAKEMGYSQQPNIKTLGFNGNKLLMQKPFKI